MLSLKWRRDNICAGGTSPVSRCEQLKIRVSRVHPSLA
jgi:hypothetical protein